MLVLFLQIYICEFTQSLRTIILLIFSGQPKALIFSLKEIVIPSMRIMVLGFTLILLYGLVIIK